MDNNFPPHLQGNKRLCGDKTQVVQKNRKRKKGKKMMLS